MIVRVLLSTGSSKGHARIFWKASEGCAIGSDYIMYTKLCADSVWATEARAEEADKWGLGKVEISPDSLL